MNAANWDAQRLKTFKICWHDWSTVACLCDAHHRLLLNLRNWIVTSYANDGEWLQHFMSYFMHKGTIRFRDFLVGMNSLNAYINKHVSSTRNNIIFNHIEGCLLWFRFFFGQKDTPWYYKIIRNTKVVLDIPTDLLVHILDLGLLPLIGHLVFSSTLLLSDVHE